MPFGVTLVLILSGIIIFSVKLIFRYNKCDDIADTPFKCPNCENEFNVSAFKIMFSPR